VSGCNDRKFTIRGMRGVLADRVTRLAGSRERGWMPNRIKPMGRGTKLGVDCAPGVRQLHYTVWPDTLIPSDGKFSAVGTLTAGLLPS
jgi:hypothetical protein